MLDITSFDRVTFHMVPRIPTWGAVHLEPWLAKGLFHGRLSSLVSRYLPA